MAVHNEEQVLPEKLASLAAQDYGGTLTVIVASDCSTDRTDELLANFGLSGPGRKFVFSRNEQRLGKPATINRLVAVAGGDAGTFILTDASVMLRPDTITELVRPLIADPGLGVVDSRMVHTRVDTAGVGAAENTYISREVRLKQGESRRFGYFIGPFGGCWAVRAAAFSPVPPTFLVDDFFLCMSAYRAGWRGLSSDRAVVYEGVGQRLGDEFRRKVRIGAGNWQNLTYFQDLWYPPLRNGLSFSFFSHKVLRWLTPFLLMLLANCLLLLWWGGGNYWAGLTLGIAVGCLVSVVVLDLLLGRLGIHLPPLRNLNYFLAMNAALLVGFLRYLTGIKSNVWKPSQRS